MENPKISIITPTFNRSDFIAQAIQSVLDQDYGNFEHLIVDDGSTDNTKEVIEPFLADQRLRYFYQENQGQSAARNLALAHASGDFICFLDSDNSWLPEKLGNQLEEFRRHPEVDVIYGDCITIDENGNEISRDNMRRHSGFIVLNLLKDNCVSMNTAMTRRRCFDEMGGMSEKRRVADDYDLWLRFSAKYRFLYLPEYFAYYRVMKDQISTDKTARFNSNEAIISDFRETFPSVLPQSRFDEAFASFYTRKARYLAANGNRLEGVRNILRALRYRPQYSVPWRGLAAVLFKRY